MSFLSYAQNLEDVMLWRALRQVDSGFYIDVGAWRPHEESVTLAFYERNWRGINIEPDAEGHAAFQMARPRDVNLNLALGRETGEQAFFCIPGTGLSTLDPAIAASHKLDGKVVERQVTLVGTLREVCDRYAPADIHFLKIDVEGAEATVLEGADFGRHRPWIVVVEATLPNSSEPSFAAWEPILLDARYVYVWFDGLNRFYIAEERQTQLSGAFMTPPNVFDNYVSVAGIHKAEALDCPIPEREVTSPEARGQEARGQEAHGQTGGGQRSTLTLRAERAEAEARAAAAQARLAELQALTLETDAALALADASAKVHVNRIPVRDAANANITATGPRVFFDASLMLFYGFETPVGLIRVEHYVAEFLARDPLLQLIFISFDTVRRSYRVLTPEEQRTIHRILFHRYQLHSVEEPLAVDDPLDLLLHTETEVTDAASCADDARLPDTGTCVDEALAPAPEQADRKPDSRAQESSAPVTRLRLLRRRLRSATTLSPEDFNVVLLRDVARVMAVQASQTRARRLGRRVARRLLLGAARGGHAVAYRGATALTRIRQAADHITRPDPHTTEPSDTADTPVVAAEEPSGTVGFHPGDVILSSDHIARPDPHAIEPLKAQKDVEQVHPDAPGDAAVVGAEEPSVTVAFRPGDVLLSMANTWDYMDYTYLQRICYAGVRFVAVVYDVIAMRYPFTTPGQPHVYHRHWVEIGHCASHLLAISKYSMDMYRQYVSEPNDLPAPISYAYLPNFLRERAAEIGEESTPGLQGQSFVMFCSTIETRKNQQLLVHIWDRLYEEIGAEQLPTLVFVGKWGWGTETMRLLTERNWRLRQRLRVLDRVSDAQLIWLYRNALFTVFPAISEGFGLAAAESLSFGTPVIVSDCPALVEASEGLMPSLDHFDLPGWLDEIRGLILHPERLEALRKAAARYGGADFETFAATLRDIALSVTAAAPGESAVSAPVQEDAACRLA